MDEKLIHSLWDRFDRSDVSELVYECSDGKLVLKREKEQPVIVSAGVPAAPAVTAAVRQDNASAEGRAPQQTAADRVSDDGGIYVRSPLPGTFYRAASPDEEPFVMIGKEVHQGDVIGIVESMKMMNEIVADTDGIVAEILAEDGTMVGYDEKLIRLEK